MVVRSEVVTRNLIIVHLVYLFPWPVANTRNVMQVRSRTERVILGDNLDSSLGASTLYTNYGSRT